MRQMLLAARENMTPDTFAALRVTEALALVNGCLATSPRLTGHECSRTANLGSEARNDEQQPRQDPKRSAPDVREPHGGAGECPAVPSEPSDGRRYLAGGFYEGD